MRWTAQNKLIALGLGLLLLALLSYALSWRNTLQLRSQYHQLKQKKQQSGNIVQEVQQWQQQNARLDQQLGGADVLRDFQENLLATVGVFCQENNLALVHFSEPLRGHEGGYQIETMTLKVEGGFKPLLQLLHRLEQDFSAGRLASAGFVKEKDFRKNKEQLFLKIHMQKISKDESTDL